jgi:hypothetical protein
MDSLFGMAIYPFIALFLAGILFIHLGLRSKASLLSFLSITLLMVWQSSAHTVFHFFTGSEDPKGVLRMSDYSAHPNFDAMIEIVGFSLFTIFVLSFFIATISVSANNAHRPLPACMASSMDRLTTRMLWVLATVSMAFSLLGAVCYRHIGMTGYYLDFAIPSAVIALSGLACGVLLLGVAIDRRFAQSRRT